MYEMSKQLRGLSKLKVLYKGPDWNPVKVEPKVVDKYVHNKPLLLLTHCYIRNAPYVKYDVGSDLSGWAWAYALIQLAGAVVIRKRLEIHFSSLNYLSLVFFAISVVWALAANGALLQKTLTLYQERLRIAATSSMVLYAIWQVSGPLLSLGGIIAVWATVSLLLFPWCKVPKSSRSSSKAE